MSLWPTQTRHSHIWSSKLASCGTFKPISHLWCRGRDGKSQRESPKFLVREAGSARAIFILVGQIDCFLWRLNTISDQVWWPWSNCHPSSFSQVYSEKSRAAKAGLCHAEASDRTCWFRFDLWKSVTTRSVRPLLAWRSSRASQSMGHRRAIKRGTETRASRHERRFYISCHRKSGKVSIPIFRYSWDY